MNLTRTIFWTIAIAAGIWSVISFNAAYSWAVQPVKDCADCSLINKAYFLGLKLLGVAALSLLILCIQKRNSTITQSGLKSNNRPRPACREA